MKEHNYTIPLTDALESGGGCFLCKIEDMLEENALSYYMGAAVMEPSVRIETNREGFCRLHAEKMLAMPKKKLPLLLALQTRLLTLQKELRGKHAGKKAPKTSCAVCGRATGQMEKCLENCVWLLKHEPAFLEKYLASDGVCLHHFYALQEKWGRGDGAICDALKKHMEEKLSNLAAEIDGFTRSFDYRNTASRDMAEVPAKAVETLTGRKG